MSAPERLDPREVERRLRSGEDLLLVCAYEGEVGFAKFPLPGALSLRELRARLGDLPKDAEIVFYCRCPDDKTAVERALELRAAGWEHANVLAGGWKAAQRR